MSLTEFRQTGSDGAGQISKRMPIQETYTQLSRACILGRVRGSMFGPHLHGATSPASRALTARSVSIGFEDECGSRVTVPTIQHKTSLTRLQHDHAIVLERLRQTNTFGKPIGRRP
jgi:hypothetical protein